MGSVWPGMIAVVVVAVVDVVVVLVAVAVVAAIIGLSGNCNSAAIITIVTKRERVFFCASVWVKCA